MRPIVACSWVGTGPKAFGYGLGFGILKGFVWGNPLKLYGAPYKGSQS